jgi:tetratricopeptide (TPR) repeat protein
MNCEQCEEQVFELIEREAIDPAGVREILDRCPNCHALFDEMKAALAAVDQLPLEEPSARIDAEVLRAAAMRRRKVKPIRRRRLQAPPWAMAAIALLAVGIGVLAIPRDTKLATEDELATPAAESVRDTLAEPRPAAASAELEETVSANAEQSSPEQAKRVEPPAKTPVKPSVARRERAQARRKTRHSPAPRLEAAEAPPTESAGADAVAATDMPEAPAANTPAAGAARTVALASEAEDKAKEDADKADQACKKTVASFEERRRRDVEFKPDPEQQLALGRCYAKLGDRKRARTWLERAIAHPKTRTRAQAALRELPTETSR